MLTTRLAISWLLWCFVVTTSELISPRDSRDSDRSSRRAASGEGAAFGGGAAVAAQQGDAAPVGCASAWEASQGEWVWNATARDACWRPRARGCVAAFAPGAPSLVALLGGQAGALAPLTAVRARRRPRTSHSLAWPRASHEDAPRCPRRVAAEFSERPSPFAPSPPPPRARRRCPPEEDEAAVVPGNVSILLLGDSQTHRLAKVLAPPAESEYSSSTSRGCGHGVRLLLERRCRRVPRCVQTTTVSHVPVTRVCLRRVGRLAVASLRSLARPSPLPSQHDNCTPSLRL